MKKCKSLRCIFMPILGLAGAAAFSVAVMLLWNWLMPEIFGITAISFWQALGLLALTRILFGSMGRHGHHGGWHGFHGRGGNVIRAKWEAMTPQEREVFMKKHHHSHHNFEDRCCKVKNEESKNENE